MEAGTDLPLVVRLQATGEFLGVAGLHNLTSAEPEVGIWIKEQAHGCGYGREAVATAIAWASRELGVAGIIYPVVVENRASRRLAESLGGVLVGTRTMRKQSGAVFDQVVYRIPPVA
jgi:RimJ/RimL family protein N-acetyltransferase